MTVYSIACTSQHLYKDLECGKLALVSSQTMSDNFCKIVFKTIQTHRSALKYKTPFRKCRTTTVM